MLDVELYKIIDPGHFWCKPYSRDKTQQEQYYTLIGKINDYCSKVYDQSNSHFNKKSSIPSKGKICLVKRTSDKCWYRAKILSVFQTINGPQARVSLVDLGEKTLIPGLWVQEIPEEFISIPFQTMECVLSDLKPITLVTSYFDLTTTKQQGDTWDVAALEWFRKQINGAIIQVDVKHIDEDGVHHVLLFANVPEGMMCLNDELINKDFAVLSKTEATIKQDQNRFSSLNKEHSQELFIKDQKDIIEQSKSYFAVESDSSDSSKHASYAHGLERNETHSFAPAHAKYPPITNGVAFPGNDAARERNGTEFSEPMTHRRRSGLSSDEEGGKVRFLSARLPATGCDISPRAKTKQLKPILKTSSGYSSSEQENVSWNVPRGARLPRNVGEQLKGRRSTSAHDENRPEYVAEQKRPVFQSDVQQQDIPQVQRYKRNTTEVSLPPSHASFSLPFQNGTQAPVIGPSASSIRSTRISLNSETRHNVSQTWSPHTPSTSQSSSVPPHSPSWSPHVPTPSPSQSSNVPTPSPLQSSNVPTPSPSQSPHVPTLSPSQSSNVPTPSPSRLPWVSSPSHCPSVPSPSQSPRVPSSPMPSPKLCHVSKDVFIHGEGLPRPITQLDSNIFPETLLRKLREMNIITPSSFQSNVWPAILRGRDVCGIGEANAGNPLTYLLPILTQIAEPGVYSELPMGNGPLALVLCSGWRKAAAVYDQCCKLTKEIRNTRVQIVFGAGAEDERILPLINGCEIIIATPPCFLRMLKKGYTRLDRLCHLVFDDADILVEERMECIKEFMREYGGLLASQPNRLAPRQCIAMGNKWTPGVSSLVKAYLGNPLILISNPVETAMFCKVRQTVKFVSSSQRDSQLIGLLDSLMTSVDHEIIIFTSAAKDAERLSELLQHYSYSVLIAHEFMRPEQLHEVHRQWNTPHSSQSYPVVVMTDGVTDKCNIRNSSCVIHYDFPPSKMSFGKRLFCMAASYPSTKEKECLSVIFGTETTAKYAQSMTQIVTRAGGEIPAVLKSVTEMAIEVKEERKKHFNLCYFLKVFGVCKKSLTSCKERHTVFPDVDVSERLPRCGIVKLLVLKVFDASQYYVRILEHRNGSEKSDSANYYSGATFLKLALDLNSWYSSSNNRRLCGVIQLRKLCVVEEKDSYHRVKILRVIREDPETNRPLEVQVYFVDRGDYEDILTRCLLEIDPQFIDIPFQAVEAIVCRMKPVDEEKDWTKKSYKFVQQNIEGKELEGKVVMGLGNTIWLDPLVARIHLKEINVTTNTFNVRMDLLKEGLAVPNPKHVNKLTQHLEEFVTMKQLTGQENSERSLSFVSILETAILPEDDYEIVMVSAVENPELLYVRLDAYSERLENLLDEISAEVGRPSSRNDEEELTIGSLCVAKFTKDDKWYRAKIFSMRPEGEYDVFYVDYGDREWITKDRIMPAWSDILQLPYQAIECTLVNICPIESEWKEEARDVLWDMTEEKQLHAKVKSKCGAMFAGTFRYCIELYDTSSAHDVLVNHELVLAGVGQATLKCHKTLFPEAFEGTSSGEAKEQFEEIPEMCLQLYKTQDPNMKLNFAKEIKNIVSENLREKDAIRESGGVGCVCRLLGVSKMETVQEYIVIALAYLAAQNEQNRDEIRREGGLKAMCYLLTKTKSVKVQEHSAWALKNLATTDRNRDTIREFGGVTNLCLLLNTTDDDKVQENICWAIVAVCTDNDKNCDTIREAGGLDRLFSLLKTAKNDSILENVMWAISFLTGNAKNKMLIGEIGGIETICTLVKNNQNDKVFKNAVQSLKTLSSNDNNREIICRLGIIDVMRRLTDIPHRLPFDTHRLCLDLTQRLLGRTSEIPLIETFSLALLHEPITCKPIYVTRKKQKSIKENDDDDLPPLEDTAEHSIPAVHPTTMWSQTKRFLTLAIKLRGVENKVTDIGEKTFYFRTKHLGKNYELNFEFFADVLPKQCKVNVRGSEVLVNLKKAQPSTWKRLLASPEKLPYLSIDFDRWDTDSSDEGDTPRSRVRVPMTKSSKTSKLDYTMPREEESESDFSEEELDTREAFFDFS